MNHNLIAGTDEVGRGPLAGPVIAAAVILPEDYNLPGLTDSKKLTPKKRDYLFDQIQFQAIAWAIGSASVEEIDKLNILQASLIAMSRAIASLSIKPTKIFVDGHIKPPIDDPKIDLETVIGGDLKVPCISAASIIAKVTRDRLMLALAQTYPAYGWDKNMGYPTKSHVAALAEHGITPHHRTSFAPVRAHLKHYEAL